MSSPDEFLHSLGHALSTMALYGEKHAARERAASQVFDHLLELLEVDQKAVINFVDGEVIFGNAPLGDFKEWKWSGELTGVAVERIEIERGVASDEFQRFLAALSRRLSQARSGTEVGAGSPSEPELRHIQFGRLAGGSGSARRTSDAGRVVALDEEVEATDFLLGQAGREGSVSGTLAEAVVRSVSVAIHQSRNVLELLVPLKEIDQYTTVHSMNCGILTMAFAESLGFAGTEVKALGEAALLHDVGKTRISEDILQKPDRLSDGEWEIVQGHPVEGARILLNSGPGMELAAMVAYEHHMRWDGTGYPKPRYDRKPHRAARLVQVCDVYDALRTRRSFRDPWDPVRIVDHLMEQAGKSFDPEMVRAFMKMLGEWAEAGPAAGVEPRSA